VGADAQELVALSVSRGEVGIGEPFQLQLQLQMMENSKQTVCNLVVDFGDGRLEQVRVTSPQLALAIQHAYQRPGPIVIKVGGKARFQGFNTALGCVGGVKTAAINVLPDDFAARRAAAVAAREAALRRAEGERRGAEAAAEDSRRRRAEAEVAARRAREKLAAEKLARDRAASANQTSRAQVSAAPTVVPAPAALAPGARAPVEDIAKPKPAAPKAKSSLDL
jgi:hypothetical protein